MGRNFLARALFPAVLLSGCAIHPLPEDTTRLPTYLIVERVRCEARDAVFQEALRYLEYQNDPELTSLVAKFRSGEWPMSKFSSKLFTGEPHDKVAKYEGTAIAYNFSLDMSEVNNLDAIADFGIVWKAVTGTFGLTAGLDRTRENLRTFTITDTFSGLLTKVPDAYCENAKPYKDANYVYPIAGHTGMDEIINNFINLSEFTNLTGGDASKPAGPPTTVDTLTFTTKVYGSATPKVVIAPLSGAGVRLADASLSDSVSRTDVHKVIIGLSLPVKTAAPKASAAPTTGLVDVRASATEAEKQAAHAVEQYIVRFEIGRAYVVINP